METVKNLGGDAAEFLFDHDNDPSDKIIFAQKNNKLNISETIYRDNFSMTCYASKNNNLCIYHNGNIVKCTVDFDDLDINIVGNILPNGEYSLKEENLSWWTNYELFDTCKECEIYPVCYGKKCPRSYFNPEACDIQKKIYYSSVVCV